jgi:hypothetical protein
VNRRPSPCANVFTDLLSWDRDRHADDKDQRRLQGAIPDFIVNGTAVRPARKKGKGRLHGTITLVDIMTLCNLKDHEGQNPSGATNKREQKVHTGNISAAKELGKKFHGSQGGQAGPVEQRPCQYGKPGNVHATVLGTSEDAFQGVNDMCDLAVGALAHEHL